MTVRIAYVRLAGSCLALILTLSCAWADSFLASQAAKDAAVLARTTTGLPRAATIESLSGVEGATNRTAMYSGPAGNSCVLIENSDGSHPHPFRLVFDRPVRLLEVSNITGLSRRRGVGRTFSFELRPGSARLFIVSPKPEGIHLKPKVMINPSVQYGNVILGPDGQEAYNEGETMWDIAVRVKAVLDADGRVEAHLSRDARRCESTIQRECEISKLIGCDAFVALHSDATADGTPGGGTWTFFADDDGKRLGEHVHARVIEAIKLVYPQEVDRGLREHWNRLYVLHNSGCPACLTEILFHSNPVERDMLRDATFQDRVAHAVAAGILEYFCLAD